MSNTFGMEIEFDSQGISQDYIYYFVNDTLHSLGKRIGRVHEETNSNWTLKTDGSCGWEITSPALTQNDKNIKFIDQFINRLSRRVMKSNKFDRVCTNRTGIHIHLSQFNNSSTNLFNNVYRVFYDFENALFALQPPGRSGCNHVSPLRSNSFYSSQNDRHLGKVVRSTRYSTFEFRHASSTLYHRDVKNWILLLMIMYGIINNMNTQHTVIESSSKNIDDLIFFIKNNKIHDTKKWLEKYVSSVLSWMQEKKIEKYQIRGGKMKELSYFR